MAIYDFQITKQSWIMACQSYIRFFFQRSYKAPLLRMVQRRRDFLCSSRLSLLFRQGHLHWLPPHSVQKTFSPCLITLIVEKLFVMNRWNFLGFNLYTSLFVLSMGKIICFNQNFIGIGIEQILLRHVFHAKSSPLSLPFLHKRCSNPFIPFVALCWILSTAFLSLLYSEVKNRILFF